MDNYRQDIANTPGDDEFMAVENFGGKKRGRESGEFRPFDSRASKKAHVDSSNVGTPISFPDINMGTPFMPLPITPSEDFYRQRPSTPLTPTPIVAQPGSSYELLPPSKNTAHELEPSGAFSRTDSFSNFSNEPFNGAPRFSIDNSSLSMPPTPGEVDQGGRQLEQSFSLRISMAPNENLGSQAPQISSLSLPNPNPAPTPLPAGFPAVWEGNGPPPPPPQGFVYLPEDVYQAQQGTPIVMHPPPPGFLVVHESILRQQQEQQQQQQPQASPHGSLSYPPQQQQSQGSFSNSQGLPSQQQGQYSQQNQNPSVLKSPRYAPPAPFLPNTPGQPSQSPRFAPNAPFPSNSNPNPNSLQSQPNQSYQPTQSPRYAPQAPFSSNPNPNPTPQSPRFAPSQNPFGPNPNSQPGQNFPQSGPLPPRVSQQFGPSPQLYSSSSNPNSLGGGPGAPYQPFAPVRPQTPKSQAPPAPFQPTQGLRPITPKNAPQQPFTNQSSQNPGIRRIDGKSDYPGQPYQPIPQPGHFDPNAQNYFQGYPPQLSNPNYRPSDYRYPGPQPQGPPQPGPQSTQYVVQEAVKTPESVMHQRLGLSKSPVLDALVYCALNHWGLKFVDDKVPTPAERIMFEVDDFDLFLRCATDINSKNKQTNDTASRIKALRRWFDGIPNLRNHKETFTMIAKRDEVKNDKLRKIVERMVECFHERSIQLKREQEKVARSTSGGIMTSGESESKSPGDHLPLSMTSSSSPRITDKKPPEPFYSANKNEFHSSHSNRSSQSSGGDLKNEDLGDLI